MIEGFGNIASVSKSLTMIDPRIGGIYVDSNLLQNHILFICKYGALF